jgi:hypothetical protein
LRNKKRRPRSPLPSSPRGGEKSYSAIGTILYGKSNGGVTFIDKNLLFFLEAE